MKTLTTYLSLFILLLALGACGVDSATGPDPDPDQDPDQDPPPQEVTNDDIIGFFNDVVFGVEIGTADAVTRRWEQEMRLFISGEPEQVLVDEVETIITELNNLTGGSGDAFSKAEWQSTVEDFSITITDDSLSSNAYVLFGSGEQYAAAEPFAEDYVDDSPALFFFRANGQNQITSMTSYLDIFRITDNTERRHLLREIITQSLGFTNSSDRFDDSIFDGSDANTNTEYLEIDETIIQLLYHPDMRVGLKQEQGTDDRLRAILNGEDTDPNDPPSEIDETKLTGDGGFGFHAQIDGTRAIVGAPGSDEIGDAIGAAYIYELQGDTWTQTAQLLPSDPTNQDLFGHTVAIQGNRVLVSAHGFDTDRINVGAVYVFELQGGSWVETQKLSVDDSTSPTFNFARDGNQFGRALALDGNVIVVGAHNTNASGLTSGLAFIYELQNGTWVQTQDILPEDISNARIDPPGGDKFGRGLDVSGTTIVVGSPQDADNGGGSGSAYIFEKVGNQWVEMQKLLPSDLANSFSFGFTLSIDGDRLVVAGQNDRENGQASGAVHVFERQGDSWSETAKITPGDAAANALFGFDAELRGDVIVVGAAYDDSAAPDAGEVYIFEFSNGTWSETDRITASDAGVNAHFGYGIGFTDAHIIVGASDEFPDIRSSTSGSAYIYERE